MAHTRPSRRVQARRRRPRRARPAGLETRERILAAALEIFSERGFDGTTTRDIAARAAVNLGLIKYYFDSKEKLWKAAVDRASERLRSEIGAAIPGAIESRDALAEVLRVCVRFAAKNPAFIRLMNDEGKRDSPRMRWLVDRHGKPLYEMLLAVLARGRRLGLFADVPPIHLYYVLIGAIGLIFSQAPECRRITGVDPTASAQVVDAHVEVITRLMLAPGVLGGQE